MIGSLNYYEWFGLPETCTPEMVDRAWKLMMRKVHPDLNPNVDPEIAKTANRVRDTLKDPVQRKSYDAWLAQQRQPVQQMPVFRANRSGTGNSIVFVYNMSYGGPTNF